MRQDPRPGGDRGLRLRGLGRLAGGGALHVTGVLPRIEGVDPDTHSEAFAETFEDRQDVEGGDSEIPQLALGGGGEDAAERVDGARAGLRGSRDGERRQLLRRGASGPETLGE